MNVQLGLGHNNDQGMLHLTKMDIFIEDNDLYWLADKGYHHHRLVTPNKHHPREWNELQSGLRSVVESSIGVVQKFGLASSKVRQTPELQKAALLTIYNLANLRLRNEPLRPYLHVEEAEEHMSESDDDDEEPDEEPN